MKHSCSSEDFIELQERVDALKAKRDQATGALKSEMKRLKDEFGLNSVEEAKQQVEDSKKRLEKIKEDIEDLQESLRRDVEEIELELREH